MRLLDLFCGAGGASMGYHQAGFEVVGADFAPQPNYPFKFMLVADALLINDEILRGFDVIHASPPCQAFTNYKNTKIVKESPDLIDKTRDKIARTGRIWIIENVYGAPLISPVVYCGSSFGLDIRRHRFFESNLFLSAPECDHDWQTPRFPSATNRHNLRSTVEVGANRVPHALEKQAMGIDWMTKKEITEAIPPAYTEHIGRQVIAKLS